MVRTYAVGDVHGCLRQLKQLVELCEQDASEHDARFIFLGDYIDRGPDSRGAIKFLMALQHARPKQVICLMGNHEDMLLAATDHPDWEDRWLRNGGIQTLESYGVSNAYQIPKDHIDWLRQLPKFHDDGLRFFVHAGVDPHRPLAQQDDLDLLWIREPFLSSNKRFERLIVHGHTPTENGEPDIRTNRVNIDTGAVFGNPLTAAVFTDQSSNVERILAQARINACSDFL
ncbi:MAG: serine/threonine protein phosphatase [Bradyrhizobiaceae bacterium]|nr:MAG: serine/threonine protein phosphatase [Bradyrhizobiaceae bacterium]